MRTMCQVLEVSTSAYYEWQVEQESRHSQRDGAAVKENPRQSLLSPDPRA